MMKIIYKNVYIAPAFLLAFIFGGAIIGENVSLSLIVSELGSSIIGKLYLVNGLLLLGLPVIIYRYIDKVDRGKLLSSLLIITAGILSIILSMMLLMPIVNIKWISRILITLYPVSYLSKTILFFTFWTFANDAFNTNESKTAFPIIAAWGFGGGLAGACFASILLKVVSAEMVIALWIAAYIIAWFFSGKMRHEYKNKLITKENLHETGAHGLKGIVENVLALKLVRFIAIFYFFIFLCIFSIDYLFWFKSHQWFNTSESIASFQFSFYLFHGIVTIAGLRFLLPFLISKAGFTRILYFLPVMLMTGALLLLSLYSFKEQKIYFQWFIVVQFLRYITFEIAFSPIFQMFFAAIEKDKRGRAKTFLEGIIKPCSMIMSGLILISIRDNAVLILSLIVVCCVVLLITVFYIRRTYVMSLLPHKRDDIEPQKILEQLGSFGEDDRLLKLVKEYSVSDDIDMKIISVKLLAGMNSSRALEDIIEIYENNCPVKLKEIIARSLENFYGYQSKSFIERLLNESNPRIRSNALYSLNRMICHWKIHFKPLVRRLLFDPSIRVQIEAACYLWETADSQEQINVNSYLESLLKSANSNRRSAGLYLAGVLKTPGWENILLETLKSSHIQVYTKSAEMIFNHGSSDIRVFALKLIETLDREHITIAGKIIEATGVKIWQVLVEFLPLAKNRRMVFEVIRCLRTIADSIRSSGETWFINDVTAKTINDWILDELEIVYKDAIQLYNLLFKENCSDCAILEDAVRECILRFCEWAVSAMVLLDKKGVLIWRHNDIDIREYSQRLDLIEIIESTSYHKIGSLVLPLLKDRSWEALAKVGKGFLHIKEYDLESGLLYFLKSDNRWLCLSAMYIVYKTVKRPYNPRMLEILNMISQDSSCQVAETASDLMSNDQPDESKRIKAFELLERVLFLKKTVLFHSVGAEKLMKLAEIVQEASYSKDALISSQGELSDILYIVKKGVLRVVKSDGASNTVIRRVLSGDTYGEIGLFTQTPRSASAFADEDCELLMIRRGIFKKLMIEIPDIALSLLEVLSERLRKRGDVVMDLKKHIANNCIAGSELGVEDYFT